MTESMTAFATTERTDSLLAVVGAGLPVPLVTGATVPYANLDYAASAPALRVVAEHLATALPYYASVHRGAGYASQVSTALLENSRLCIGRFLGAREDDLVVFTRNTTDALNLLAHCVPQGGSVLYLDIEHHANLLPWQRRGDAVLEAAPTLRETLADVEAALAATPTALLAVTGASNVTGQLLPIRELAEIAHRHGARIAVDAAQLAPHRRFSLTESGVDYLALSGHKLYAPYGAGVLIGRRDWLDAAPAYLAGGGAVREVGTDGDRLGSRGGPARGRHAERAGRGGPGEGVRGARDRRRRGARRARGRAAAPAAGRARAVPDEISVLRIWADEQDSIRRRIPPRTRRSASSPSPSPGTTPAGSPRTSRPSTGSACATAASARTRCSPAGPGRRRGDPRLLRRRLDLGGRGPAGAGAAHAADRGRVVEVRARRRPLRAGGRPPPDPGLRRAALHGQLPLPGRLIAVAEAVREYPHRSRSRQRNSARMIGSLPGINRIGEIRIGHGNARHGHRRSAGSGGPHPPRAGQGTVVRPAHPRRRGLRENRGATLEQRVGRAGQPARVGLTDDRLHRARGGPAAAAAWAVRFLVWSWRVLLGFRRGGDSMTCRTARTGRTVRPKGTPSKVLFCTLLCGLRASALTGCPSIEQF
jgi:hypothetical protein